MSGGPYRSIVSSKESDFTLLSGELTLYYKTGDSGNPRELAFCNRCGSHIYATSRVSEDAIEPRSFGLRTGILDEVADFVPKFRFGVTRDCLGLMSFSSFPQRQNSSVSRNRV